MISKSTKLPERLIQFSRAREREIGNFPLERDSQSRKNRGYECRQKVETRGQKDSKKKREK